MAGGPKSPYQLSSEKLLSELPTPYRLGKCGGMTKRSSELVVGVYGDRVCYPFSGQLDTHYGIEDIVLALSHICRFGGRCHTFYSVAQHSIHVCSILAEESDDVCLLMLHGLLHDAAEALLGDVPTPLKNRLEVWDERGSSSFSYLEGELHRAILQKLGVPMPTKGQRGLIYRADQRALAWEAKHLLGSPVWAPEVDPRDEIDGLEENLWTPEGTRESFMELYQELMSVCAFKGLLLERE